MKNPIITLFIFCLISCNLIAQNTISGEVNCINGGGVEGVTVELIAATGGTMTVITDALGNYTFNNVPSNEDYTIHVEKDGSIFNGVTTYDLILIMEEILDPPFDSPFFFLAADVNSTGTVSTLDLVLVRKVILAIDDTLPAGIWRFATEDFSISPAAGYVDDVPLVNLQSDLTLNFVAVHVGDMNSSASDCN